METLAINREGRLTPDQRIMLSFLLEAQRLGAGLGGLMGFGSLAFFGCIIAWGIGKDTDWGRALEFCVLLGFGVYSIWNSRRNLGRLARFAQSLQSGRVASVDGEITWNGRRYAVRIPVREKLDLEKSHIPGPYRFYYVPYSGRVLSAERLGTTIDARSCLLQALMNALHFNAQDIAANRMGRMPDSQRTALLRSLIIYAWTRLLGTLIGGVFFVILMVNYQMNRGAEYGWTIVLAAAPFMILFSKFLADYLTRLGDLRLGRVEAVQGLGYHPANSRQWQINCDKFEVSKNNAAALISGLRYRAFYLPHSRYLISLEPLPIQGERMVSTPV